MNNERATLIRKVLLSAIADTAEEIRKYASLCERSRALYDLTEQEREAFHAKCCRYDNTTPETEGIAVGALPSHSKLLEVEEQLRDLLSTFRSRFEW